MNLFKKKLNYCMAQKKKRKEREVCKCVYLKTCGVTLFHNTIFWGNFCLKIEDYVSSTNDGGIMMENI